MDINKAFLKNVHTSVRVRKGWRLAQFVITLIKISVCVCVYLCVCVRVCDSVCVSLETGCDRPGLANIQEADGLFKMERTSPAGQVN